MSAPGDLPDWITQVGSPQAVVYDGPLGSGLLAVAQYASLTVTLYNLDGTTPLACKYIFRDPAGANIDSGILSADVVDSQVSFTVPVNGPVVSFAVPGAQAVFATVVGNPTQFGRRTLMDASPFRTFQAVVPNATPNGTATPLPGIGMSLDAQTDNASCYNGTCTFSLNLSAMGSATAWALSPQVRREDGTAVSVGYFSVTTAGRTIFTGGHPFGFCTWLITNTGLTTANVTVTLNIIPAENT